MKLKLLVLIFAVIILFSLIFSIDIEYENTWTKRTEYTTGSVIYEEMLYVNTWCSIESFNILSDGQLDLFGILEIKGVIRTIQLDEEDQMLYIHYSGYTDDSPDWIDAYKIINCELVFSFSSGDLPEFWSYKDIIYPVGDYVVLIQPDFAPCYNKQTQALEPITYPYQDIIGAYDNILIDYNEVAQKLNFYQIEDINNPVLLYQYDYEMIEDWRGLVRNFDDNHCLLVDRSQVLVFDVEDLQNITYETTWQFNFTISNEILKEPLELSNNRIYFGSAFGDNFIYNVSDYTSPVLINSWFEEDYDALSYCIFDNNWLYRTMGNHGIWKYELNNMPTTQYEEYGHSFPLLSTEYFDGSIYKNDFQYVYKVNTETQVEEIIYEISLGVGWSYYKHENLLIIENGDIFTRYCTIINLNTNQVANQFPLVMDLYIVQNGRMFFQNNNLIEVYEINDDYELEFLTTIEVGTNNRLTKYDDERIWISYGERDFLFNSITLQIDHDFEDFFSPGSSRFAIPRKYDHRLIIGDFTNETRLYDISNIDNPILLDTKTGEHFYYYFVLDDYILETYAEEPVCIYNKFDDSFTDPIQVYDFNTLILDLKIDEERNRILTSSYYYFKSYLYELTGNGIEIVPEFSANLSNYPNPFNPETTISFSLTTESTENTELVVYNIKGQKVKQLINEQLPTGQYSVVWDGTNEMGKPVASGVYYYQLKTGSKIIQNKALLLK
ncbi:MAG: FlgD immunoglobulin-like domain containing protein [Candidatus Cloacimonadales bacterium]|nr:FlgD immunoglobulin-like domain containing protein [Candidatus Cloacimonadales bacterium]